MHEGTFGVGYGICTYETKGRDPKRDFLRQYEEKIRQAAVQRKASEDAYVRLARQTIETYVRTGRKISIPEGLPEELYAKQAGVFVSLKEEGKLRGCIGTIAPVRNNIAEEIIENAISASARDPRFRPVQPEELDKLVYRCGCSRRDRRDRFERRTGCKTLWSHRIEREKTGITPAKFGRH